MLSMVEWMLLAVTGLIAGVFMCQVRLGVRRRRWVKVNVLVRLVLCLV